MSAPLLPKGFEVELYTGRRDGVVVGCAAAAAAALEGFVTEPDNRNLEYTTPPDPDYRRQLELLLEPRRRLRRWLAPRDLTLLPGSTLSLGDSRRFIRSDPSNPYHDFIESTYGTRVVTASVHINLGITSMEALFAGLRLLRCEAALLLALSASSPFLDGRPTGVHSQRWLQFPLTPQQVPLFHDHRHFVDWMGEQLAAGAMRNVRHLWTSVRPNGEERPQRLNRLEIRICDLIADPLQLLAVTVFAELRVQALLADPESEDPLRSSRLDARELAELADANDRAAARDSLDAPLHHWRDGASVKARDWIASSLEAMAAPAAERGLTGLLTPLHQLLAEGNTAMRWLDLHRRGETIGTILAREAEALQERERSLEAGLATDAACVLG